MMNIITNPRERTRFLKFLLVGTFGFVVDFGIFNLLYRGLGVNYVLAGDISLACAIVSNFIWNRYWTYPDSRSKPIFRQFAQFAVVNLIGGLPIRSAILKFVEPPVTRFFYRFGGSFLFLSADLMGKYATFVFAVFVVLIWNFFVNRYWTYSDVES